MSACNRGIVNAKASTDEKKEVNSPTNLRDYFADRRDAKKAFQSHSAFKSSEPSKNVYQRALSPAPSKSSSGDKQSLDSCTLPLSREEAAKVLTNAEKFVNPDTKQEVYFTEHGIFLPGPDKSSTLIWVICHRLASIQKICRNITKKGDPGAGMNWYDHE